MLPKQLGLRLNSTGSKLDLKIKVNKRQIFFGTQ